MTERKARTFVIENGGMRGSFLCSMENSKGITLFRYSREIEKAIRFSDLEEALDVAKRSRAVIRRIWGNKIQKGRILADGTERD